MTFALVAFAFFALMNLEDAMRDAWWKAVIWAVVVFAFTGLAVAVHGDWL